MSSSQPRTSRINKRELNWSLQRMARIIRVWRKTDRIDREFLLRKFRDEYPQEFWQVANEQRMR
jgi:hypothetical protein